MPSINGAEYLVILVVALLVFGPHRLPELTHKVGGWMREVRKVASDFRTALESEVGDLSQPLEDLKEPLRDLTQPLKDLEQPLKDVTKPVSAGGPADTPDPAATTHGPVAEPVSEDPVPDTEAGGMLEWKGPVHASGPTPDDARADYAALSDEEPSDDEDDEDDA